MSDKFIYLKTDMSFEVVDIPLEERVSQFNQYLGSECFEVISLPSFGDLMLIVDEAGKLYDEPKPINVLASLLYPGTQSGDYIVGDVLVGKYGWIDGEPDVVGLFDPAIQYFTQIFEHFKEIYNGKQ